MCTRNLSSPAASALVCPTDLGVSRLLEDLTRLSEDKQTADIAFVLGKDETPIYAHKLILQARCSNFTPGEIAVIDLNLK